jgi:hypothetical protein
LIAAGLAIGLAASIGTYLSPGSGLETPVMDAMLAGRPVGPMILRLAPIAVAVGVATSVVAIALDRTFFLPWLRAAHLTGTGAAAPLLTAPLYALAGGVSEPVLFQYGLLAVLARHAQRFMPQTASFWIAITVAAVALGLFHIAMTTTHLPSSTLLATRTFILVFVVGFMAGWLYWRRGLEAAILASGIVNFVIHVAVPSVFELR